MEEERDRTDMNMIVAVDRSWGIGYQNKLLNSIPEDMKFFRETTTGKIVVMGRKTLESFPGGRPLKNRTNVVLTTDTHYAVPGAEVVHTLEEALAFLAPYDQEDIYVIENAENRTFDPAKDYYYPIPTYEIATSDGNVEQNPGWR